MSVSIIFGWLQCVGERWRKRRRPGQARHRLPSPPTVKGLLGAFEIIGVLVGMDQERELAVLPLEVAALGAGLELQHLPRIQVEVCRAGLGQPRNLRLARPHLVALLDGFNLQKGGRAGRG